MRYIDVSSELSLMHKRLYDKSPGSPRSPGISNRCSIKLHNKFHKTAITITYKICVCVLKFDM